jgi:hypothetical protein
LEFETSGRELTAVFEDFYAETENAQGRCQALQGNRDGEDKAGAIAPAAHPDVEEQETQTESGISRAGERRGQAQSEAHDSVPIVDPHCVLVFWEEKPNRGH